MRQRPRLRLLALTMGVLSVSTVAIAGSGLPKLAKGASYAKARNVLMAQGWTPLRMPDADPCQPGDSRCAGRPEMQACSGTGLASCVFLWRKRTAEIEVVTIGSSSPIAVSRLRCRKAC